MCLRCMCKTYSLVETILRQEPGHVFQNFYLSGIVLQRCSCSMLCKSAAGEPRIPRLSIDSAKGEACALGALCQAIRRLIVRLQSSPLDLG